MTKNKNVLLITDRDKTSHKMLSHREILKEVWGDAHTEDKQYLRVFIGQIREKIEKDPSSPTLITTNPGIGYRMEIVDLREQGMLRFSSEQTLPFLSLRENAVGSAAHP